MGTILLESTDMFSFKTKPFDHQLREFEQHAREEYRGLLFEQRTGKSKVILDSASLLHSEGRINALFILAPNGVHRNWVSEEIPIHLPDWVERQAVVWTGADTKKQERALESLFNPGNHLRIFTMNIEAIGTKRGFAFAQRFLRATEAMFVVDESTRIKNPDIVTVKNLMKLRDLSRYRRILNGTPITQGPLDMYSQLLFLSDEAVPVQSYVAFRNRYAEYASTQNYLVKKIMRDNLLRAGKYDIVRKLDAGEIDADDHMLRRWVPVIQATDEEGRPRYKNLDELKEWVDKCCTRVLRKDCSDIPEKLYKRWSVEYPAAQEKLVQKYLNDIKHGYTPEPVNKLSAVMYYQQMLCGRIPRQLSETGEGILMYENPMDNPRIKAVLEVADAYPGDQIIFWARFKHDLHTISNVLEEQTGENVARYWGDISNNDRELSKQNFQAGKAKFFVGQPGAGGVGLPLHAAGVIAYHSNTFSLYHRLQSEDRAENMMKTQGTVVIDMEVPGTVDTKIITALRDKKDVADLITGDESVDWLS